MQNNPSHNERFVGPLWNEHIKHILIPPSQENTLLLDTFLRNDPLWQNHAESVYAGIIILDTQGIVVDSTCHPVALSPPWTDEIIGKPFVQISWWSYDLLIQQRIRTAIDYAIHGQIVRIDTRILCPSGSFRDIKATITPQLDIFNNISCLIYSYLDTTEKRRTEEDIRMLINAMPQLVWMARADGYINYANQRWLNYTGMTLGEIQDWGWSACLHPDDFERTTNEWRECIRTGKPFEVEQRLRNIHTQNYRWFLARGEPVRNTHGEIVQWIGTVTDIHEQKLLETALRTSYVRFKRLFTSNIIGIALADIHGRVIEANQAYLDIIGYSQAELEEGLARWNTTTPDEYRSLDEKAIRELLETGTCTPFEKVYRRHNDGRIVPVLLGGAMMEKGSDQLICFIMDMTPQKELEKKKDEFISIASHELKTPLAALKMLLHFVKKHLKHHSYDKVESYLMRTDIQVAVLTDLINDLLDVSKIRMGRFSYIDEMLDLDVFVRRIIDEMQETTTTHNLHLHGATSMHTLGDKHRLSQVFTNLLTNAIKYSPQANTVDITLTSSEHTAFIQIRDYGIGIPEEFQANIFERFNRGSFSKEEHIFPGLGMGLYIAHEIINHYGGTIKLKSEAGYGTTFTVSLPIIRTTPVNNIAYAH
ncbi:PAS domain S-box protein [Ktedonospora formicarum]|uniref:histidine kinase n=1 Tax=Ktedonospora formicarum TaxID=2778364 RepID=A0A8J3I022_9CHLR|nr:PAS domain S-box protein [Ktedonospora formicarum]GHO46859.1 hypothetical protein KSX_50220 [Ktedonospora formicarum]